MIYLKLLMLFSMLCLFLSLIFSLLFLLLHRIFKHKNSDYLGGNGDLYVSFVYLAISLALVVSLIASFTFGNMEIKDKLYIEYNEYKKDSVELYENLKPVTIHPESYFIIYELDGKITQWEFFQAGNLLSDLHELKNQNSNRLKNQETKIVADKIKADFNNY